MSGRFEVQPQSENREVFGRWTDRQRGINVYWVQDLPKQQDYKIVLTLQNNFIAPFLGEPEISKMASESDARPNF